MCVLVGVYNSCFSICVGHTLVLLPVLLLFNVSLIIVALSLMSCCWSCLAILSIPVRDTIKKSFFVFWISFSFSSAFVFFFLLFECESTDRLLLLYNWILLLNFHLLACIPVPFHSDHHLSS